MAMFVPLFLGGLKAVGSIVQGAEESASLKATEQASRQNAAYAFQDAQNELQVATADAEQQRRTGRKKVAEQITGFAQSGFGLGSDATSAIEDSASNAELDALTIQYRGALRSRADQIQGVSYEAQADAAKRARKTIPFKTALGAATNLLSGYASSQGFRTA